MLIISVRLSHKPKTFGHPGERPQASSTPSCLCLKTVDQMVISSAGRTRTLHQNVLFFCSVVQWLACSLNSEKPLTQTPTELPYWFNGVSKSHWRAMCGFVRLVTCSGCTAAGIGSSNLEKDPACSEDGWQSQTFKLEMDCCRFRVHRKGAI